jgi:hypothetical protein
MSMTTYDFSALPAGAKNLSVSVASFLAGGDVWAAMTMALTLDGTTEFGTRANPTLTFNTATAEVGPFSLGHGAITVAQAQASTFGVIVRGSPSPSPGPPGQTPLCRIDYGPTLTITYELAQDDPDPPNRGDDGVYGDPIATHWRWLPLNRHDARGAQRCHSCNLWVPARFANKSGDYWFCPDHIEKPGRGTIHFGV